MRSVLSAPSQWVIEIKWIWRRMQDEVLVVKVIVQEDGARGIVQVLERAYAPIAQPQAFALKAVDQS